MNATTGLPPTDSLAAVPERGSYALACGLLLATDALGVDLVQDTDAVPGPFGDLGQVRRLRRRGPATPAPLGSLAPASGPLAAGGTGYPAQAHGLALDSRRRSGSRPGIR